MTLELKPRELKPQPAQAHARSLDQSLPLLDHLALRLLMLEHEPQPPELKPEHTKLKPREAKALVSGVRELKPLELKPLTLELKPLELKPQPPQTHARCLDQPLTGSFSYSWLLWGRSWPLLGRSGPLLLLGCS